MMDDSQGFAIGVLKLQLWLSIGFAVTMITFLLGVVWLIGGADSESAGTIYLGTLGLTLILTPLLPLMFFGVRKIRDRARPPEERTLQAEMNIRSFLFLMLQSASSGLGWLAALGILMTLFLVAVFASI